VLAFDVSDEIQAIACPALVLGAGEDRVLGVQASYDLIEALHGESYIYEGYGHAAYDEAPDYLDHIAAFLKGA
jgi:pimeloyl-ACP methyl ester carboxylesterase